MASLKLWMTTVTQNISGVVQNLGGHVGTLVSHGVHGMTGWGGAPKALESAAASGSETTVARGDHVHPTTGLMTTNHPTYPMTGFGATNPAALGTASPGGADTTSVSRSDHVHPMPSAGDVGAATASHTHGTLTSDGKLGPIADLPVKTGTDGAIGVGAWGTSPANLNTSASGGSSSNFARADHVHAYPTASDVGAVGQTGNQTLAGDFSLSAAVGERAVNIGTGRTGAGSGASYVRFYTSNDANNRAEIYRGSGLNSELSIINYGTKGITLYAPSVSVKDNSSNLTTLSCGTLTASTAMTVNGTAVSLDGHTHAYAASSHTHGNVTNDGKIGSTANLPIMTGTGGVLQAGSFGSSANTFCVGNDARLSNSRTPTSHTHGNVTNDGKIGSTTGLPVITTTSGALTTGTWGTSPANLGASASGGSSTNFARADHVHAYPTAANVGAANVAGSGSQNFDCNRLQISSGYIYCWDPNQQSSPTDLRNVGNFSLGNRTTAAILRNEVGFYFYKMSGTTRSTIWAGDIYQNGVQVTSDVRAKKNVTRVTRTARPFCELADRGIIRYRFQKEDDQNTPLRLGIDAEVLHEIMPDVGRWTPRVQAEDGHEIEPSLRAIDLVALITALVQEVATLTDRLDALESRR